LGERRDPVLGEAPPDASGEVLAVVEDPAAALVALAADIAPVRDDPRPNFDVWVIGAVAERDDLAGPLVPGRPRQAQRATGRPRAKVGPEIAGADPAGVDADQGLARPGLGVADVLDPQVADAIQSRRLHRCSPWQSWRETSRASLTRCVRRL